VEVLVVLPVVGHGWDLAPSRGQNERKPAHSGE
jgi:hypothetical protein